MYCCRSYHRHRRHLEPLQHADPACQLQLAGGQLFHGDHRQLPALQEMGVSACSNLAATHRAVCLMLWLHCTAAGCSSGSCCRIYVCITAAPVPNVSAGRMRACDSAQQAASRCMLPNMCTAPLCHLTPCSNFLYHQARKELHTKAPSQLLVSHASPPRCCAQV